MADDRPRSTAPTAIPSWSAASPRWAGCRTTSRSPPPVHELTARVRQRRTRRFAVASAAAAAAAVLAGVLVLAARPDGDTRSPPATPRRPRPPATSPLPAAAGRCTDRAAAARRSPADTLAEHGLELTTPAARAPSMLRTSDVTNRGDADRPSSTSADARRASADGSLPQRAGPVDRRDRAAG